MPRFVLALLFLPSLALPSSAQAGERRVAIGSFDRLRVLGAFEIAVTTGSPGATVVGDPSAIADVDVRVEGTTLTIRTARAGTWREADQARSATPLRILLSTPRLSAISVTGASKITAAQLKGASIDLAAMGAATISAAAVDGDRLAAQQVGEGRIALAGRVGTVRLFDGGTGTIDAVGLDAGDLTAHLDGPGTIRARARYTAQVTSTGLGTVEVAGRPKCRVMAPAGAPVTCGGG
jgi:hypothetical protein